MNLAEALAWASSPLLCSLKQLCPNVQLYKEAGCAYLRPRRRANLAFDTQRNKNLFANSVERTRGPARCVDAASGVAGAKFRL
jgi:hypothetical protein